DVRVKRPGLKVLARKGYASPRGKTPEERLRDDDARRKRESKKGGTDNMSPPLRDALNSPMQQGSLTFAVQAAPFRKSDKEASIALAIEFDGQKLELSRRSDNVFADSIELSFFGVTEEGKPTKATRTVLNLTLRPDTYQRVRTSGLRVNTRMSLPPGRYQVRVGAREAAGDRVGSVFYGMQVPDFSKDPLMMSGLLLTAPSSDRVLTALPDQMLGTLLPGAPTSGREFLRNDTLSFFAEIYDNAKSTEPRQIDVLTHLFSETGTEVFVARDTLANGGPKKWDAYAYTHQVPLQNVPPGRYLLRVEAQTHANGGAPVSRETVVVVR